MAHSDATGLPRIPVVTTLVEGLLVVIRAFMGSLLGISTASVFAVFALVGFAGLSLGVAITSVALAMNAMLLSLVVLGNLGRGEDDLD
jgi:hypothetical protein